MGALAARRANRPAKTKTPASASAADLLAVSALSEDGVLVRGDGALVRYAELVPANPDVLSDEQAADLIEGLGYRALARLRGGQDVQFYVEGRPVQLKDLLAEHEQRTERMLDHTPAERRAGLRELAGAYRQTLSAHALDNAAMDLRVYVIAPFHPRRRGLTRNEDEHREALRASEVHLDNLCADLDALGFSSVPLNGREVAELLYRAANPSTGDRGHIPRVQITGELDAAADREAAIRAARALRNELGASPADFSNPHYVRLEDDLLECLYVSSTAENTPLGWLLEPIKDISRPFSLSVHVHARERVDDRKRVGGKRKRLYALNEGGRRRGQTPNPTRLAQEDEVVALDDEMRKRRGMSLYATTTTMAVREPHQLAMRETGQPPNVRRLAETADDAANAIRSASGATAKRPQWLQQTLLQTTWPLGLDVARERVDFSKQYATPHVAASLPVFGGSCGSPLPHGALPLFMAKELGTLEGFNPWDRRFINRLMLVNGLQGSGKTMLGITIASMLVPLGVNITVVDRSDHWKLLTELVPGGAHLSLGPGRDHATINPWGAVDPGHADGETIQALVDLHEVLIGDRHAGAEAAALSPLERSLLDTAIRETYATVNREREPRSPLERDLKATLERLRDEEREKAGAGTQVSEVYDSMARRLDEYVYDGRNAYLADRPTSVPADAPLTVFDMRHAGKQIVAAMFIALQHTLAKIERRRHARLAGELPSDPFFTGDMFATDEAWQYFQRRATAEYFHDLVRRSRHLGLYLLAITQHLDDFNNAQGLPLLRSATMKVFFQQSAQELHYLKDTLDLTEGEIATIKNLGTAPGRFSRAYLINGPRGRGEVTLRLGRLQYWAATSNPDDQPARAAALERHKGDPWAALHDLAKESYAR
jgi:hypothetical protein